MNKLELAHEWAKLIGPETNLPLDILVDNCFDYAEAMLAEDEKRKGKGLPEALQDEFVIDWSLAPSWANWWCFSPIDNHGWWSKSKPLRLAESWAFEFNVECSRSDGFGYEGDWKQSLRKRPE